jgi:hypothetical protein
MKVMSLSINRGKDVCVGIRIRAYDAISGEVVGEFDSATKAANSLFIHRCSIGSIIRNATQMAKLQKNGKGRMKGITSYKTGLKYNFSIIN